MYRVQDLQKFRGQFKKFYSKEQDIIRSEIRKVLQDPLMGEMKKGALSGIRVHKFKIRTQQYLLAYDVDVKVRVVCLYALATHEGFYEALQQYVQR